MADTWYHGHVKREKEDRSGCQRLDKNWIPLAALAVEGELDTIIVCGLLRVSIFKPSLCRNLPSHVTLFD